MIGKKENVLLAMLTVASLLISIITISGTGATKYVHTLSTGLLLSSVFFYLVVYLPDWKRRQIVVRNFVQEYDRTKLSLINKFLILSDSQEYPDRENLLVKEEFRRYFKGTNDKGEVRTEWNSRWVRCQ